jgi:uncharacterized protein DUF4430
MSYIRHLFASSKEDDMSRVALTKTKTLLLVIVIAVAGIGAGVLAYVANSPSHKVQVVANAQHQTVQLSYKGQNGVDALTLLKKHAAVQTKHYSFGDFVTAINGSVGNGPKYWTFYVNGKESNVGASSYSTKNGDTITWKLQ